MDVLENWSDLKNVSVLEQASCLANYANHHLPLHLSLETRGQVLHCTRTHDTLPATCGHIFTRHPESIPKAGRKHIERWEVLQGKIWITSLLLATHDRVTHVCV